MLYRLQKKAQIEEKEGTYDVAVTEAALYMLVELTVGIRVLLPRSFRAVCSSWSGLPVRSPRCPPSGGQPGGPAPLCCAAAIAANAAFPRSE